MEKNKEIDAWERGMGLFPIPKCEHPLSYLHSDSVRHYCPDCGRFLLDSEIPESKNE